MCLNEVEVLTHLFQEAFHIVLRQLIAGQVNDVQVQTPFPEEAVDLLAANAVFAAMKRL